MSSNDEILSCEEVLDKFNRIRVLNSGGELAPYKPLLILWAIGRLLRDGHRWIDYRRSRETLESLFNEFKPIGNRRVLRKPFYRLMKQDKVWEIPEADGLKETKDGDVSHGNLKRIEARGGFTDKIFNTLMHDKTIALCLAGMLVEKFFAPVLHERVLKATLGEIADSVSEARMEQNSSEFLRLTLLRRRRQANFRRMVLPAYHHSCAVCNHSIEYPPNYWPSLEAAHIRSHSQEGPDEVQNGLALCATHHELFDCGLFTITPAELCIRVSEPLMEHNPKSPIIELNKSQLRAKPTEKADWPAREHLEWHSSYVFKGNIRCA